MNEIASREFMDNLVSLLKVYGTEPINDDVKSKILELIQNWASGAEARPNLVYISETYKTLQREGMNFPPRQEVAASMFDSSAPPEWADSDVCMRCRTAFSFTNRKHHCRNCGNVFCQACSSKSAPLPHLGILQPVRVDDGCYAKLMEKTMKPLGGHTDLMPKPSKTLYQGSMQPRSARVDDSFDADLKKALELSLEESGGAGSGYVQQAPQPSSSRPVQTNGASKTIKDDDDDADLKAAIAASIADMEEQKTRHTATLRQQGTKDRDVSAAPVRKPEYELSPVEAENINLFSTLVDRLQHQPPGMILREPQIQELYDSIGSLRPKLARTYGETMSKYDTLVDLHTKMSTVVRYYDRMLEERLNSSYHQSSFGYNNYASAPPRASSMYPNIAPGQAPSAPNGYPAAGPESYYGSQAPSDPYARPQSTYGQPVQAQYPQTQYPQYPPTRQRQGSGSSSATNRAPSMGYRQSSMEHVPQAPGQYASPNGPAQQQYAQPSQQHTAKSSDPAAAYYYGNAEYVEGSSNQHQQQPHQGQPQYEQSPQYNMQPGAQQQPYPPHQQSQVQQPPGPQYTTAPQAQAQQPQYQAQAANPMSFPAAPTHQPQSQVQAEPPKPVVEEALIEL